MTRNHQPSASDGQVVLPNHPIISDTMHRDTLDRVVHVIELLEELDMSQGLSPGACSGLYWIHRMLIDSVKHVNDSLAAPMETSQAEAEGGE